MQDAANRQDLTAQQLPVYRCADLTVVNGANLGDPMAFADELALDDVYELSPNAHFHALSFQMTHGRRFRISDRTALGTAGATLHLDSVVTLMPASGDTIDAILLVEVDVQGNVADVYVHPLTPLAPATPYSLVRIDREDARRRMAFMACVSFSRGTRITTATGEQVPIEALKVGDSILTRDSGVQKIRWIGRSTVRATGPFAPVVITAGTLNNLGDLTVSQDHRLFIYQRQDHIGAGNSELLVKARHLVNDDTVYVQEGGFVDFFQLLFDDHQIIYAEGISAETMMVTQKNNPVLPPELRERLGFGTQRQSGATATAQEVHRTLLNRPDAAELLRRASSR
jgi:hypothetical protein